MTLVLQQKALSILANSLRMVSTQKQCQGGERQVELDLWNQLYYSFLFCVNPLVLLQWWQKLA